MDRIFSARIDDSVLQLVGVLARRLGTTKKAVIERAVTSFAERLGDDPRTDVFALTAGAWRREESAAETVTRARTEFRKAMERHHS